jgi:hypothetical protein
MSIYARLRVLLALLVLVIGGSVWLIAGAQRQTILVRRASSGRRTTC